MSDKSIVIVGAGQAAAQCVLSLRTEGWQEEITLIGEEATLPYHRPPLSKAYLSDDIQVDKLPIRPLTFYQKQQIQVCLDSKVVNIDRANQQLQTASGEYIKYDKLCLATGVRARQLQGLQGSELSGIFSLRTLVDIDQIKHYLSSIKKTPKVILIGGGYIGLETAASLIKKGYDVTILEVSERILGRVTSPMMSAFFSHLHYEQGVKIYTEVMVQRLLGEDGKVTAIELADGRQLEADMVLVGIGVEVNDELAKQAHLNTENGIIVDDYCQTNDENIFAIGDCTWHYNPMYQRWLRLESVQNANDQAKVAAKMMVHADKDQVKPYNSLPWFWSDQYDIKLQIAGLSNAYDDYQIDGKIADKHFSISYYREGQLIALDAINQPRAFMQAKKQLTENLTHS